MSTSWATAAREVPGLDHDPCPGDVPGTRRLAHDLRARADRLGDAAATCRGWDATGWTGPAATRARATVAELADRLALLARSMADAGAAVEAWADELSGLQGEAAALGEQALDIRRRRLASSLRPTSPVDGLPLHDPTEPSRLEDERRTVQHRAEELHVRWQACARRRSALLDSAAPASATGWWRGAWDLAADHYQLTVRTQARVLAWGAEALGVGATVSGAVALVTAATPAGPVAGVVSLGLGLASTQLHAQLAVGADGSPDAAVIGVATGGVGVAVGGAVRATAGGGTVVRAVAETADDVAAKGVLALDVGQLVRTVVGRGGAVGPGTVTGVDGAGVPVTVHEVSEPWHVGHGLRGSGFAGVATVPVTAPAPGPRAGDPDPEPRSRRRR